jgi:hypothetical protein
VAERLGGQNFRGEDPSRPRLNTPSGQGPSSPDMGKACVCGHGKRAHEHYRKGTDCAFCECSRFHRSILARLGLRPS